MKQMKMQEHTHHMHPLVHRMHIKPLRVEEPAEAVYRARQADVRPRVRPASGQVGCDDGFGPEVSARANTKSVGKLERRRTE